MDQRRATPARHEGFCTPGCPDGCPGMDVGGPGDTASMATTGMAAWLRRRQPRPGTVWVVWDGPGGRVFDVCDSLRSVAAVRKFHRGRPLQVMKLDPMRYRISGNTLMGDPVDGGA